MLSLGIRSSRSTPKYNFFPKSVFARLDENSPANKASCQRSIRFKANIVELKLLGFSPKDVHGRS